VRVRSGVAAVAAAALVMAAGACGTDDRPSEDVRSAASARPSRIVSLSATATEMLFAIGAGDRVVAVDEQSNYPPEVPRTDLSGYKPNVEAIAARDPDLVVISDDGPELKQGLKAVGIDVVALPAAGTLDDTYSQIEQLGDVTGHTDEASRLVGDIKREITSIRSAAPESTKGATYYHELDPSYFSATSKTFIGSVYALLGLQNIADPADDQGAGYPQLSAEFIVQADPDFIFLADMKCCQQSAESVRARDGWDQIGAVKNGAVVALDDDVASRWGPRIVDFLRTVAARLSAAEKAA
jgi:iron complex transport system substrate-binding protein